MILQLHIKNIALIEECTLSFGDKLTVLSGETGAGKSIIIDSLGFVLGARADKGLIRHGASQAQVEAVFDVSDSVGVKQKMVELGLEEEDTLILSRTMSENKSEVRLNGKIASLSMLKELGSRLVDILGQHENQSLLSVSTHIDLLDKYGEKEIFALKTEIATLYDRYREIEKKLSDYGDEQARARKIDLLKYQIDEIAQAELKEGEEESLLADRERFRNSEKILNAVGASASCLEGDEAYSAPSAVSMAMNSLKQAISYDPAIESLYNRLDSAYVELKDILDELTGYIDSFDFDDAKADFVEKRVDLIRSMKRKYGATVEEILSRYDVFQKEYETLLDADAEIEQLQKNRNEIYSDLIMKSDRLTETRKHAAKELKSEIERELSELGMKGSIFEVSIGSAEEYLSETGCDRVEFLISPNPGEPVRSLSKIISGGEMSRFMLALKVITSRLDGIQTLVFDEVDAGISGKIGEVVAEKLALVSATRQVIAITHLPQVAAMSDSHYLIEKTTDGSATHTSLIALTEEGIVKEVERLSAGAGTYGSLHAQELRSIALRKKDAIRSSNNSKLVRF
ncbi:MAG TPA: DNA repair protein RecN [Clostridiales bacterium]|nr:DNA repair protein RecN [Clostridiales bacterium]